MPLTLRTLPRDERQGIDLPEHFRWGLWPAFLPVWVLDVYYGVCTSSLLELSGMEQLTAIHHSVYPYSYSDAFHKRALTRLSRWLEYEIPMDVLGSLNMLADLRLVSVSGRQLRWLSIATVSRTSTPNTVLASQATGDVSVSRGL